MWLGASCCKCPTVQAAACFFVIDQLRCNIPVGFYIVFTKYKMGISAGGTPPPHLQDASFRPAAKEVC